MAQLPEAIYLPGPDEPAGVLTWGKSPEQSKSDQAAAIARIGGSRIPNYAQSYLLSANTLLRVAKQENRLDHHGLPIFFLQRHAVELMIKALLQFGVEVQRYREKLGHQRPNFPTNGQADRAENSHGLHELLSDLDVMCTVMQVGIVPDALRLAIKEILKVEKREHTWSRYSFRKEGPKGAKTRQENLPKEITIPLGTIQNLLQAANDAIGSTWPFDGSLMGMLWSYLEPLLREAGDID